MKVYVSMSYLPNITYHLMLEFENSRKKSILIFNRLSMSGVRRAGWVPGVGTFVSY